ncbi:hypothetical protein G7Y89_g13265 [Cudoniella acicularis]|uniref:Rhodopsin domain-containing protein n=1 Tax=Cudoniella acicularis TaxID=354080 RepID=A0A8H4R786_9HELO|nr:hypothetical protein G7Y89_g13265 [Cudoniella acicularis]
MSLADIPPAELPFIPALEPPNGTLSNFLNPKNRADAYIAVAGVFLVVLVVALLSQAAYTVCTHGIGKHMWDVRLIDLLPIITPARVMADITEPSIGLTKLALLLLYYRLFSPSPAVKIAILSGIVFILTVYTTLMFLFIFLDTARTIPLNKTMAVINVATDCYILVLPIYSVVKLYLPKRKKIGLALVFATGLFAVIMSIVGAVYRFQFANDGTDFTWGLLNVILVK